MYFVVFLVGEVSDVVSVEALELDASELEIKGDELGLVGGGVLVGGVWL